MLSTSSNVALLLPPIVITFNNYCQESLRVKYEMCRGGEVESVEKEWEKFRDMVMKCTNDLCGIRRVGGQRRKGSEW